MTLRTMAASVLILAACSPVRRAEQSDSVPAPRIAAHQHLISPAFTKIIDQPALDGAALLRMLDAAGIQRGVVLSMGYSFGDERKKAKVSNFDPGGMASSFSSSPRATSAAGVSRSSSKASVIRCM